MPTIIHTTPQEVRFSLYSYAGIPKAYYIAKAAVLPAPTLSPEVGHHVIILDRSGSMWGDPIREARAMIEKVCTLAEYADSTALVSLVSYSSAGDCTVHFSRVSLQDAMHPGSSCVEAIRSIQATAMTCASQAIRAAIPLIRDNETTCLSVHTDGWFNHTSPADEARKIDALITELRGRKGVFVNTIAYGWADTSILLKLANALSGKCVQARTSKEVYDALADTTALLAGRTTPAITVPIAGTDGAEYQALVSVSARKINGTTTDLKIQGLRPEDDAVVWRYRRVSEAAYAASTAPVADPAIDDSLVPVYAFCRTKLAEGRLNQAKYALLATRDIDLIEAHMRALTVEARAALAADLDARLAGLSTGTRWAIGYGLDTTTMSVLDLAKLLGSRKDDWCLDLGAFVPGYAKRGLKRIPGTRVETVGPDSTPISTVTPPTTRLDAMDDPSTVSVSGFKLNNANASLQMRTSRDAALVEIDPVTKAETTVRFVAGKKLDLSLHRAYSLVGDGAVNAKVLPIRIASKALHADLVAGKVLPDAPYSAKALYPVPLDQLPVIAYDTMDVPPPAFLVDEMIPTRIWSSVLGACLPGGVKAALWTDEQKADLGKVNLSTSLNYSAPTTTPYADLGQAIATGLVDTRTSTGIELMTADVAGLSVLYSANEYLNRRFTVGIPALVPTVVEKNGQFSTQLLPHGRELAKDGMLKKATLLDARVTGAIVQQKVLTPKATEALDGIDAAMMPILTAFLTGSGLDGVTIASDAADIARVKVAVDAKLEAMRAQVRPLVFAVGSTGLVPDSWGDLPAMTSEQLLERHPGLFLAKKQKDGTFFETGAVILAIYQSNAYFSTPLGIEAAKAMAGGDVADTEDAGDDE